MQKVEGGGKWEREEKLRSGGSAGRWRDGNEGQRGENGVTVLFMGTSSAVPGLLEMIY